MPQAQRGETGVLDAAASPENYKVRHCLRFRDVKPGVFLEMPEDRILAAPHIARSPKRRVTDKAIMSRDQTVVPVAGAPVMAELAPHPSEPS